MSGLSSLSDVVLLERMLAAARRGRVPEGERRAFGAEARGPLREDVRSGRGAP
ncbi:hypothetical protein MXAN_0489 [Myxococcus xanthus DK 1622]|uniref:Uncharacterized protein n=1 Tax=Myxococcus xanthus (strain DK1622) TaxID=246197 RepID=Q1DF14_MYXXD|nr:MULTISPECIES: hypothetical protein [Myxococcus]ABF86623.1 hypothetical protein MXAN_0489 [Myxococcus xanthus DK 1622]NOJ57916.1 hypothetical protein [Myxococcus xanthus]QPM80194.1 hypothetical protein I5Q59_02525 [Myxococcus xanthus]QVW69258.1 hypothetical protein JTM82_06815 [Myxococcus xanthus DZ2]QZZ48037.1 hypothetical protein MyxoNM_02435 [Myxococcus xanthus]